MAAKNVYSPYAVVLKDTADVVIGAVTSESMDLNTDILQEATSGSVWPEILAVRGQGPVAQFASYALKKMLDNLGITGMSIDDLAVAGVDLYAYLHAHGGIRAGATSHIKYSISSGMVVPRTLSVDHQGDAIISADIIITFDGTLDPIVITGSQSVPGGVTDVERHTLGGVTVGPEELNTVGSGVLSSLSIDFGNNIIVAGGGSDIWPTHVSIQTGTPVISFTASEMKWLDDDIIPLEGLAATHLNTKFYLRKRKAGGVFVADNEDEHISATAAGLAHITSLDMAANPAEISVTLPCYNDGSNDPIVFATATPIT
jgi:hypothetical protein